MKDLIIVGAGNMAREVLQLIKDINHTGPKWHIKGFIADWGQDIKGLTNGEFDIIGTVEEWQPKEDEVFVCAIITPQKREKVVKKLKDRGAEFIKLIHPTASLNDYCTIGEGAIICPNCFVGPNAKLGDYVIIDSTVVISHDVNVGKFTTICPLCSILGEVQLGERVFVGFSVTIIDSKRIGNEAFIGVGSVVIRNVAEGTKVFGNPAKRYDFE